MNCTDKYSQHSSIIWPVWVNGSVFIYELVVASSPVAVTNDTIWRKQHWTDGRAYGRIEEQTQGWSDPVL